MSPIRLPVEPLIRVAGLDRTRWAAQLSRATGVSTRTCHRWALTGLTVVAADRAAVAFGLHPLQVWGPAWHADLLEVAA
jgi:hypothetical protein